MGTISKVFAAVLFGLIMIGCQIAPIVHLLNMSGREVSVHVRDEEVIVSPGGAMEFAYGDLAIRFAGCSLKYKSPALPKFDSPRFRGLREHINVRLEPSWAIVILSSAKEALDGPPLDPQPDGFPVMPNMSGDCG